ncbi:hypothetical protein HMPREF1356_00933, partial [Enterococcus faecium C1904]
IYLHKIIDAPKVKSKYFLKKSNKSIKDNIYGLFDIRKWSR